mmetsp:Transcript_18711/g.47011  ORF Transcript_18711/g.47011 Transcript_18711/m.47011 type:complete len:84 (+) Transcript_18711:1285-1536(+)
MEGFVEPVPGEQESARNGLAILLELGYGLMLCCWSEMRYEWKGSMQLRGGKEAAEENRCVVDMRGKSVVSSITVVCPSYWGRV